ncbi:hypothetical protein FPF71_07675 [Algibacter amylolyticus]|uniref:Uncharacterized protein n=2 Tax=Algibacter TaxID=261827 RepID=A0A5M7BA00_9FLAO|nr:hypothetical protein [Algibacter amylolyticus]KAA5825067.1 hypothetical protein F2B50_07675 [Algibacter amylolyticus]MBB5268828.1 hypothetical protein [Algibacter amylolyticus]TSJ77561.1 hypothetical protein FPF71_07675 [Algibacter amylolyticus]
MTNTLKYLGLILILSVIGFLIRDYFFDISFSQIENENTQIVSRNMSGQFYSHIIFALSIGIIPLLYLIIKKITKLNFMKQGLISCGIILVSGILLWQFRIFQLNSRFQKLSEFDIGNGIQTQMDFDNLNFGRYLFIGFLIGTILSILIFKNRNKTVTE